MRSTLTDLRAVAAQGAADLGPDAPAEQVLAWGAATFGREMIVASNMQDAVLVELAAQALPGVDVLFLETGYHFPETLGTRDAIAAMYDEQLQSYIDEHHVLVNPLVAEGYPSIGCRTCTAKPLPGADPRSGRWAGIAKTECGLHG